MRTERPPFPVLPSWRLFWKAYARRLWASQAAYFAAWVLAAWLLASLGYGFPSEPPSRGWALFALTLAVAGAAVLLVLRLNRALNFSVLCRILEEKSSRFENLTSALEFAAGPLRGGTSEELALAHCARMESILKGEDPSVWMDSRDMRQALLSLGVALAVATGAFFVSSSPFLTGARRLFHGSERDLSPWLKIEPAGGQVLLGEPVEIRVTPLTPDGAEPELRMESKGGRTSLSGKRLNESWVFSLAGLLEPTQFQVHWKGMISPPYWLIPVEPPRLEDFHVEVRPPGYTLQPVQTLREVPQSEVYRGTRITLEARASQPLASIRILTSGGAEFPVQVREGFRVRAEWSVQNPMEFWFEMTGQNGVRSLSPTHYKIPVREDAPPRIRLLSPTVDLLVGQETVLPLTFELRDDLGAAGVWVNLESEVPPFRRRISLRRYDPPEPDRTDTVELRWSAIPTAPGQVFKVRLEAEDGDRVTGPKSGFSQTLLVEIQSYEKEHARLGSDLQEFQKEMVDLLSEQSLATVPEKDWQAWARTPAALEQHRTETLKKQGQAAAHAQKLEGRMDGLLERMEKDPLGDAALFREYQALQERLRAVREGAMMEAQAALAHQDFNAAAQAQESAQEELESLAHLSEEVHKYSKMKDLMHATDRLLDKGLAMEQRLSESPGADAELLRSLQETLRDAAQILDEIRRQVETLPQELPDEFVNQPAMKELNLGPLEESLGKLQESLSKRDLASALEAARELLSQARKARQTLGQASEGIGPSGTEPEIQAEKGIAELDGIIEKQETLLEKTHPWEARRRESVLDVQKKILAGLAERQRRVIERAQGLVGAYQRRLPPPASLLFVAPPVALATSKMQKVQRELDERHILFSQKWLEEIGRELDPPSQVLGGYFTSRSTPATAVAEEEWDWMSARREDVTWMKSEEQEILKALRAPPPPPSDTFNSQDRHALEGLGQEQSALQDKTGEFSKSLAKLKSQTALADPSLFESLRSAGGSMSDAARALREARTDETESAQEKALAELRRGRDRLSALREELSQGRAQGGRGSGDPMGIVQPRGSPGGRSGLRSGAVRIPRADEYLPSREFREELLESLKERYPKPMEETIKQYFKKLTP